MKPAAAEPASGQGTDDRRAFARNLALADFLFPASKTWPRLDEAKPADKNDLGAREAEGLWSLIDDRRLGPRNPAGCLSAVRFFFSGDVVGSFRQMAFAGRTLPDLVYSGSWLCSEGDLSIVGWVQE